MPSRRASAQHNQPMPCLSNLLQPPLLSYTNVEASKIAYNHGRGRCGGLTACPHCEGVGALDCVRSQHAARGGASDQCGAVSTWWQAAGPWLRSHNGREASGFTPLELSDHGRAASVRVAGSPHAAGKALNDVPGGTLYLALKLCMHEDLEEQTAVLVLYPCWIRNT